MRPSTDDVREHPHDRMTVLAHYIYVYVYIHSTYTYSTYTCIHGTSMSGSSHCQAETKRLTRTQGYATCASSLASRISSCFTLTRAQQVHLTTCAHEGMHMPGCLPVLPVAPPGTEGCSSYCQRHQCQQAQQHQLLQQRPVVCCHAG